MLEQLDWIVLGLYFAVIIGMAIWVVMQKNENTEDFFLAGRNAGWFVIGASIFASNIGSEHVVGLAGTGADSGMPLAHYELHAWIVLLLGWLFLPFYFRSGAFTMPEFLEKRFDSRSRWFLSIFSIIGYVLTKVSVTIYAGGIVVSTLLGIDFWTAAVMTVVITGVYTVFGGMRAVIYTEALQTVVLLVGSAFVLYYSLDAVGGWNELETFVRSDPANAANPANHHFNMWRPMSDPDFPWTGLLFGGTIVGIWYWCTDQYIVQRTLAAHNIKIGRRGAIFGAYLKIIPIFIFLIPGVIAYMMHSQGVTMDDVKYQGIYQNANEEWVPVEETYDYLLLNRITEVDGKSYIELVQNKENAQFSPRVKSDNALPAMVKKVLPVGLRGFLAAALMAALMSSLASVFNSSSTLFTVDIFKKLYPETPEKRLVRIGQISTAVVVVLGIIWIPIMERIGGGVLYQYLQSVQAYIAPPITSVFLLGILWKRINAQGAISTLFFGLIMGTLRILAELNHTPGDTGLIASFATINFAHMAIIMFLLCIVVCIAVSLATKPQTDAQIAGLTFGTMTAEQKQEAKDSIEWGDVALSVLLVVVVLGILMYFTA